MKKLLCLTLAAVFAFCLFMPALASEPGTKFYVDAENGDDSNDGLSEETAWKTVDSLTNVEGVGPGDSLLFKRGGEYNVSMTLSNCSGSEEYPIVISSYGEGDLPVLKTDAHTEVFRLFDCSYITVENLEITAHNGGGIWIDTYSKSSEGITLCGLVMHDMQNFTVNDRDNLSAGAAAARACVMVKGIPTHSRYPVNDLTIKDCEMYDTGNGVSVWGSWNEEQINFEDEEYVDPVYNKGLLIENCCFHDMDAEATVIGMCDGALITHCRMIDCCQGVGTDEKGEIRYFTAAAWFWGSENSTFEYCEIAGQKNYGDGMTVDFDSHTNNCTYQYIYSHDNMRFIVGNAKNDYGQHNNTVRYCLSVNDNKGRNQMASSHGEYNFKFYNNTIVNSRRIDMKYLYDSEIYNNVFILTDGYRINLDGVKKSDNCVIENNCFCGGYIPSKLLRNNFNAVPGFAGEDFASADSFKLASNSPLIGAGMATDDGLAYDFFGNEFVSDNIGCYRAAGENTEAELEKPIERFFRIIFDFFKFLKQEIADFELF